MKTILVLALFCFSSLCAIAEPMSAPGYAWDVPVKFGEIQELGPDAYFSVYPAGSAYEKAEMELVVINTPRDSVMTIREAGADPGTLALVTFLGVTGKPAQINKALFLGETEARSVYAAASPRPHTVHVFQKLLEDETMVTVALRDYGSVKPPSLVGDVLSAISDSFKVQE